ncbi:MAG: hypothetical protein ACRCYB_12715 [Aeromonas veronii]
MTKYNPFADERILTAAMGGKSYSQPQVTADAQEPVLSRSQQALLRQTGKVTVDAESALQHQWQQQAQGGVLSRSQQNVVDRASGKLKAPEQSGQVLGRAQQALNARTGK